MKAIRSLEQHVDCLLSYDFSALSKEEILEKLEGEERQLIGLRYFQDMTQTEVAKKMGMSQVQISRMEKRILKKLRSLYRDG